MSVKLVNGTAASSEATIDTNGNIHVVLPTTGTQAGYAQQNYVPASGAAAKAQRISYDGAAYSGEVRQLLDLDFNAASTTWTPKLLTNATTMTKAVTSGAMRLNASAITTTTTGIAIYARRVVTVENGYEYRVATSVRTSNATATNKQADVGIGYYAFAAGQAAVMNEFIGFRWTTTGGLLGVVETSQGGAPTSQTTNINGNVPYADNVYHNYEVVFTEQQKHIGRVLCSNAFGKALSSGGYSGDACACEGFTVVRISREERDLTKRNFIRPEP